MDGETHTDARRDVTLHVLIELICMRCLLQVCKYIDIPLQHYANMTLLSMNRPPQAHTRALLQKLRDRIPGLALRTTFISGFPGALLPAHAAAPACCMRAERCRVLHDLMMKARGVCVRRPPGFLPAHDAAGACCMPAARWSILVQGWRVCAGETQADHEELLSFCEEFRFERMGAFAYSEEDGTPAASFSDQACRQ